MATDQEISDLQIVELVMKGDADAFEVLVLRYRRGLTARAYSILKDFGDAEDVAQEALLAAYTRLVTYRHDLKFSTWLYRIATNNALDRLRRRRGDAVTDWEDAADLEVVDPNADPSLNEAEIQSKYRKLDAIAETEEDSELSLDMIDWRFGDVRHPGFSLRHVFRYYALAETFDRPAGSEPFVHEVVPAADYGVKEVAVLSPTLAAGFRMTDEAINSYHPGTDGEVDPAQIAGVPNALYYSRRWEILKNADAFPYMELALERLEFSASKRALDREHAADEDVKKWVSNSPLVAAVAVSSGGDVFTCFKGEFDQTLQRKSGAIDNLTWKKHCEFSLLQEKIGTDASPVLKGGTLFVTLEPCNGRKHHAHSSSADTAVTKLPCAVRCLEAGFDTIYIGSFDLNPTVFREGYKILKTGEYRFPLVKGEHVGSDLAEIEGRRKLEEYFRAKGYPVLDEDEGSRTYRIGPGVDVRLFDRELMRRIYDINSHFQRRHEPSDFL